MKKSYTRRQDGFTLPEILAVIALIGILLSTVVTTFGSAGRELGMTQSKDILFNDIPSALIAYSSHRGSLVGITDGYIENTGVPAKSPFEDDWNVVAPSAGKTAEIKWALGKAPEPDDFGADLAAALSNKPGSAITSTSYDKTSKTLSVNYRVP